MYEFYFTENITVNENLLQKKVHCLFLWLFIITKDTKSAMKSTK